MSAFNIAAAGALNASQSFASSAGRIAANAGKNDVLSDFVDQIEARHAFEANVQVLKSADDMVGQLLNIKA